MTVTDDWVIDTYGKDLANKLIDHEEHEDFIKPVDEDGMIAMLKLDDRNITRVKYHPPKYLHKNDERGNDQVTNEICANGIWKGLLEDGTVLPIPEEVVTGQFGSRFVDECKRLGIRKFVPIPVGSCRSSVMTLFPKLRCEKAPPVKFMQGQSDRCVFSSLASAFLTRLVTVIASLFGNSCISNHLVAGSIIVTYQSVRFFLPHLLML
jgi:hypothetical protein